MRTTRTFASRPGVMLPLGLALVGLLAAVPPAPAPAATAVGAAAATAVGAAGWAPSGRARIHPGVQMYTKGAQCTGNFVFKDRRGRVYVGYSAHCAGTGGATDTDGCRARSLPLGTRVRFARSGSPTGGGTAVGSGRLAYSSWRTMRRLGTRNGDVCAFNDFALVRVGAAYRRTVNPSVPFWGGPSGLNRRGTSPGQTVYSYGSSSLRAGLTVLSPKQGSSVATSGGGWSHLVYTASPGVPGDSGSAFLDRNGKALGTLSTMTLAPLAGSNGVGDLYHELRFAQRHSGIAGLRLALGTREFNPLP